MVPDSTHGCSASSETSYSRDTGRSGALGGTVCSRSTTSFAPMTPPEHAVAREQAEHVRSAFARLSLDEQEVLELRVVAGLSSDGAAHVLGKKPGAVRMAQARALARLRVMMEEVDRDD